MRLPSPWWLSLLMGMPSCSLLDAIRLTLVLAANTRLCLAGDASSSCLMTSKGQVTIPKALRQQLGLARGSRVCFELVDDPISRCGPSSRSSPCLCRSTSMPPDCYGRDLARYQCAGWDWIRSGVETAINTMGCNSPIQKSPLFQGGFVMNWTVKD